jgi:plastocyanin
MTTFHRFAAVATAALALSCSDDPAGPGGGGGGGGGGGPVQTTEVDVVDTDFNPDEIAVDAGATVTWTWQGALTHNVTFDDASLSSSTTKTSGTHQVTFSTPGTYTYGCTVHPVQMQGEVVVQ